MRRMSPYIDLANKRVLVLLEYVRVLSLLLPESVIALALHQRHPQRLTPSHTALASLSLSSSHLPSPYHLLLDVVPPFLPTHSHC